MTTKFVKINNHILVSGQAYTNTGGANPIYTKVDNQTLNKDPVYRSDQYRGMWELETSKLTFTGTTTPPEVSLTTLIRQVYIGDFEYQNTGEFSGGTVTAVQQVTHPDALQPYPGISTELTQPFRISSMSGLNSLISTSIDHRNVGNLGYIESDWHHSPYTSSKSDIGTSEPTEQENTSKNILIAPTKFNKKSADKITNFNPSTDTLEIDTDSFGIDNSATFASGKNKKAVKKKLAKQDFDFLYDEKKGGLYFNENGSDKGFGDGGIIAILKGAPDLTSGNLEFI